MLSNDLLGLVRHAGEALMGTRAAWRVAPYVRRSQAHALRVPGMFGTLSVYDIMWEDGRPARVMDVDGTYQSATYTDQGWCDPVFEYYVLYDLMFQGPVPVRTALMLGGAGYGYPKYLMASHPDVHLDVVEKDPTTTRLAWRYFYLHRLARSMGRSWRSRLGLVQADALDYLRECRHPYDAILNDCFRAQEPDDRLSTPEAARLAHRCLVPGGMCLGNVVSALEGPQAGPLERTASSLASAFAHVYVVSTGRNPSTMPDNLMVAACDRGLDLPFAEQLA